MEGPWDLGYSLDKHTLKSTFIGYNEYGFAQYDTLRTEVGEALYRLKYKYDQRHVNNLATQLVESLGGYFRSASCVIPVPPSKRRVRQPVIEIARLVAKKMNIPCREDILVKTQRTGQMKDIISKDERIDALCSAFEVKERLDQNQNDVLIIDDLFDTGSSLEAATRMLRECKKIQEIYVATITRTMK